MMLYEQAAQAAMEGKSDQAVDLLGKALEQDPKLAGAYYLRGREYFRLGKVKESAADFDKFVELRPELESRQWERGITLFYAGEHEKGAKQFALYQTYHDNDVENSVWRYLCMARVEGVEKARAALLPIENDRRVPMMQIYELYQGKVKPERVFEAANVGDPRIVSAQLFYAHLYVGLWHESQGDKEAAARHLALAADKYKIGHYMWDVARLHAKLLKPSEAPKPPDDKEKIKDPAQPPESGDKPKT